MLTVLAARHVTAVTAAALPGETAAATVLNMKESSDRMHWSMYHLKAVKLQLYDSRGSCGSLTGNAVTAVFSIILWTLETN